jgi:hypothetical protein
VTVADTLEIEDLDGRLVEALMLSTDPLPELSELFRRPAR